MNSDKKHYSWQDYEQEKRKIQRKNLSPKEYEQAIAELAKRMGL